MKKKIIRILQQITEDGTVVKEIRDAAIMYPNRDILRGRQQLMFSCPSCGQPIEERKIRYGCPLCSSGFFGEESYCCDFCHTEREKILSFTIEKTVALEKECRILLESRVFDRVPFIRFFRQYKALKSLKKLEDIQRFLGQ